MRDELFNAVTISGAALAPLFLILFKLKGGLLGMILGGLAVATLIYWLREMRNIYRSDAYSTSEAEFFYDLLDEGEAFIFVAKVSGPSDEVEARLEQGFLVVSG